MTADLEPEGLLGRRPDPGRYRAVLIAPRAREAARRMGSWSILHRFDRICNLVDDRGAVISIALQATDLAPFGLIIEPESGRAAMPPFPGWLAQEAPVRLGELCLHLGPVQIDLRGVELWDPVPDWQRLRDARHVVARRIPALIEDLLAQAPPDSLAALLRAAVGEDLDGPSHEPEARISGAFLEAARKSISSLLAGLRDGDEGSLSAGVRGLAGLGGGLTPAGDDFLAGALLAFWVTSSDDDAEIAGKRIFQQTAPRTTTFSAAWVQAAAAGEAAAGWHPLLQALPGEDKAEIRNSLARLAQVGHTSGADALAGFLAVLGLESGVGS